MRTSDNTMIEDCHTADVREYNDRGLSYCGRHRTPWSRTVTLRTSEDTMIEDCHTADVTEILVAKTNVIIIMFTNTIQISRKGGLHLE